MSGGVVIASPLPWEIRDYGQTDYTPMWQAMREFTDHRDAETRDECWLTQHAPVYTLGLNIRPENLPLNDSIPVVETDRGGQITYHGPGQFIVYILLDLRRRRLAVKELVSRFEQGTITFLSHLGIEAHLNPGAPGVYVNGAKIASLGLKIRRGCTYHGLSLNADMDLTPFEWIRPCGYEGLRVTQLHDHGVNQLSMPILHQQLAKTLLDTIDRPT